MDIEKNWAKYNIPKVKTEQQVVCSQNILLAAIVGVIVGAIGGGLFGVAGSISVVIAGVISVVIAGVISVVIAGTLFGTLFGTFFGAIVGGGIYESDDIIFAIIGGAIGAIVGNIVGNIVRVIVIKYSTNPKRIKNIAPQKRIETLTKMCDIGNFIVFKKLWKYIEEADKNSWLEEIIKTKDYRGIAYTLLLNPKIFHAKISTYIKNNDTGTVKLLLELGMEQQIFKDDLTLLGNSSDEMKETINIAIT